MAEKDWKILKVRYCNHAGKEVSLDAEVVYPAEWMPDQPPRVISHRCSNAIRCRLFNRGACLWSGANPTYDPFLERD